MNAGQEVGGARECLTSRKELQFCEIRGSCTGNGNSNPFHGLCLLLWPVINAVPLLPASVKTGQEPTGMGDRKRDSLIWRQLTHTHTHTVSTASIHNAMITSCCSRHSVSLSDGHMCAASQPYPTKSQVEIPKKQAGAGRGGAGGRGVGRLTSPSGGKHSSYKADQTERSPCPGFHLLFLASL